MPLNKMPIKDVDSGQSMTWVKRPAIFTPLSSGHQKMIEEKVLANETSYPLVPFAQHFHELVMSQPRLKKVDLTWEPYGTVGFERP